LDLPQDHDDFQPLECLVGKRRLARSPFLKLGLLVLISLAVVGAYFSDSITIKAVPLKIVLKVFTDSQSMDAYFKDNKPRLHERLQELNVEEEIKAYYRPQIRDEQKLDQYIHQVFYDLTGYIGLSYKVNSQGKLVLLNPHEQEITFHRWISLAKQLGVISGNIQENGVEYVVSSDGTKLTYAEASRLFTLPMLEKLSQSNP
jgi:hypothetical protein